MSTRKNAIAIGTLFVYQMLSAMAGNGLTEGFLGGGLDKTWLYVGTALMMSSGVAVVGIGFLAYRALKSFNQKLAAWYPAMRLVELAVSAAFSIYLLTQLQAAPNHMLWVYVPTVIGGLVFTYLLYVSQVVPRVIAVLGLVGYAALGLGTVLDFAGLLDLNAAGMILLIPGGLFELFVLPIWLCAKGFALPQAGTPSKYKQMS